MNNEYIGFVEVTIVKKVTGEAENYLGKNKLSRGIGEAKLSLGRLN